MSLRVYVAAPWKDKDQVPAVVERLEAMGFVITCRWWEIEAKLEEAATDEFKRSCAEGDRDGVINADFVVVLNTSKSEGKAVEQGLAIAHNKPIFIVGKIGEVSSNVFHYLPNYRWVANLETLYENLAMLKWLVSFNK